MNVRDRVELSQTERSELTSLLSGGKQAARKLKRAQILLAADAGVSDDDIATSVGVGGSTVYRTKQRFVFGNLEAALSEAPRPGSSRKLSGKEEALLVATARGPYSEAGQEMHNCRMTAFDEYKAEVERRRQIGLTIDPATAETMFWYADMNDPYDILDEEYHEGQYGRERFARNPGGVWVDFNDLPEATHEALWQRDGHKLVYPYGLDDDCDRINKPPCRTKHSAKWPTDVMTIGEFLLLPRTTLAEIPFIANR